MLKNLRLGTAAIGLMLTACGSDAVGPVKVFDDEVVFVESGFDVRAHVVNVDTHDGGRPAHIYVLQVPDTICADEDVECLALYLETLSWVDDLDYWVGDPKYGGYPGGFPIQFRIPYPGASFCVGNIGRRIDVPGPSSVWESAGDGPGLWLLDIFC